MTTMFRTLSLKRRVRRGIPVSVRKKAWYRICDVDSLKKKFPSPGKNLDLESLSTQVKEDIEKDIDRTYVKSEIRLR